MAHNDLIRQPVFVMAVSLLLVVVLGILDFFTGWEFGFFVFYFIPVAYASWYLKLPFALMIALLSAIVWFFADSLLGHLYSTPFFEVWNTLIRFGSFVLLALFISRTAGLLELEKNRIQELTYATNRIKVLQGFLPICAWCKKIRNDKGYWEQLETYIHDHSEADFTHGICEECAKKLKTETPAMNNGK